MPSHFSIRPGSTPRMRGIFYRKKNHLKETRFNPAYAGNISVLSVLSDFREVQPRVCGEYQGQDVDIGIDEGSTPRMRGIFDRVKDGKPMIGFNPAYAGNIVKCVSIAD